MKTTVPVNRMSWPYIDEPLALNMNQHLSNDDPERAENPNDDPMIFLGDPDPDDPSTRD